ncbi:MAG: HD domain-containing protein [Candidatus Cloacimonetes bacterium]|nr:HD domain-containing protein [Candidatus Cloacimonadota bacterium]
MAKKQNPKRYCENDEMNDKIAAIVKQVEINNKAQQRDMDSLINIAIALSAENDIHMIFNLILEEALNYTNADGATVYRLADDQQSLKFEIVYNRTMSIRMGGKHGKITWPNIPMYNPDSSPQLRNLATLVAHKGEIMNFPDVYNQDVFDCSGTKAFDAKNKYRSCSMVAIPLKDHEDEIRGVIQLINAMDENGTVISFDEQHLSMLRGLASLAAIILTNKLLITGLETLLQQFVRSIAGAIDRKSKYTGGHITRVAEITEKIANRLSRTHTGNYKQIHFNLEELKAISMAGWMHDLGKIITPAYIMDKATKLETIFDRVELVMTRFDLIIAVMKRDYSLTENAEDRDRLSEKIKHITEEKSFVAKANTGGEFMTNEDIIRMELLAEFSYSSHGKNYFLLTKNELKNLTIRKGTLLSEEFEIMKEHASVTQEMLAQLTFPKKYRLVPLYASSHHEKLNGKGYPLGLLAEQLPLQARIIAIADLFEALTASDRPYKPGKSLSETMKIMAFMAKDMDIDANLLDFILDSGLYLEFAEEYVKKNQIDEVDIPSLKKMYHQET